MIEGIIHYNSGIKNCKEKVSLETPFNTLNFFGFQIEIPKKKDLLIMAFTILITASASGLLNAYLIKYHLNQNDK
jgi:hypothetical protein